MIQKKTVTSGTLFKTRRFSGDVRAWAVAGVVVVMCGGYGRDPEKGLSPALP